MIEGPKGDTWLLDPGLKSIALKVVAENQDIFGSLDLDKVLFVRCRNADRDDWLGKCFKLATAVKLIPEYVAQLINKDFDVSHIDIRFIIAVNEDTFQEVRADPALVLEAIVFHELLHIDPEMEKIVKHNIKDFSQVLDKYGVHWTRGDFQLNDGTEGSS